MGRQPHVYVPPDRVANQRRWHFVRNSPKSLYHHLLKDPLHRAPLTKKVMPNLSQQASLEPQVEVDL